MYLIFVDLKKAYDSVPCEALWVSLRKLGVPDHLMDIIRSFHDNMKAKLWVNREMLREIEVENAFWQGCIMSPHRLLELIGSTLPKKARSLWGRKSVQ